MDFMFKNALRDLDRRTPAYFKQEMFAHGDLQTVEDAKETLRDLGDGGVVGTLIEMLKVVPRE